MIVPEEYLREYEPSDVFVDDDPARAYWIRDGREVLFRHYPIRGADPRTFRFFLGAFAKDARACYCTNSRLRGAALDSFRALNLTYASDATHVWTLGGELKGADVATFAVCDDGARRIIRNLIPTGYARDRASVYFY